MSITNHIPATVEASLEAKLAPFRARPQQRSPAVATDTARPLRLGVLGEIKLLFAALGAGGSVVPLGDNARTAHLLARYAESLRRH
jgi:hypothetical protein